jgi:tetratricopeptide (TPR) repeat protein/DNA-binding XRE family transcriptional regulator
MSRRQPSRRGKAIRRLRLELGWSEEKLGASLGLSGKVIHNLEQGWRQEPARQEAEEIIAPMELPPAALDMSDGFGRWIEAAAPPPEPASPEEEDARRCVVAAGLVGLHVARKVFPGLLRQAREERFARDRRQADERCGHLRRLLTPQARRRRIEISEDYQTWAMAERLAHESVRAAADNPVKAKEWAELALFTVPFVPGPDGRRRRLEGYATFFLANALRVGNDLDGSDAAFQRGWALVKAGEDDTFLPLDMGRAFDLEASLRREQRRFPEALALLDKARAISPEEKAGRILLKQAFTLEQMGEIEASIEALRQARPYVEKAGEPRDYWVLLFNSTVALLHLGRLTEAEALLAEAREVAIRLGNELDLARTLWVTARLDLSLGRTTKATAALEQVFEDLLASHGLLYDAALAGMDLALLHLGQGHTQEVKSLALRMETIFASLGIEREALAALLVFCEAARREEATVDLARQTAEVIEKVRRGQSPPLLEPGLGVWERGAGE